MSSTDALVASVLEVLADGPVYSSRERGKHIYDARDIPLHLQRLVDEWGLSNSAAAKRIGMSAASLKAILAGPQITDSMLARLLGPAGKEVGAQGYWRDVRGEDVNELLAELSRRLITLKNLIVSSNSVSRQEDGLDPILVSQLVAMLEATLAAVRAPYVDEPKTKGFFSWLRGVGKKALEKGVEKEITDAIDGAGEVGAELLKKLPELPGIRDLDKLL